MTDSKTATERLREMLDERGVRWTSKPTCPETTWAYNGWWYNAKFEPWSDSTFKVTLFDLTPEQAIAATLGSGECEMRESSEYVECKVQTFTCSACGWHGAIDDLFASDTIPNFCPYCGKAVKR